ncbi:P22 phage major capsid protein family protein [Streptomyces vilmorinianum]|uniref:P22 phage major capsid protein family protein n=1 Tax=Streptomyces vilmorinianum TaxID=3051092 RepID=UPI0010FB8E52|nr:P22 phage major capsid protein family protein [Streptomyces vilmorinianum]
MSLTTLRRGRAWSFDLARHDIRSQLPAAIREIMQNGLLHRTFEEALIPEFLFPMIASPRPWSQNIGDTGTFTRSGLLTPTTTPLSGSDPSPQTYSIEQYSVTMDQYGITLDTNMLQSRMTLASKYLEDVQKLAISAGQSLNRIARDKMYAAYAGGRTWATTAGASDTSIIVQSVKGFEYVLVNGKPTPVSGANPLPIKIEGVANTVTGVNAGTSTLTLGTARADVVGDAVVADNAPVSIRPSGTLDSAFDLGTSNVVTFKMFRAAVARLRKMNVPTFGGYYTAHIDPDTETQLFDDADFKQALQGRVDSPIYRDLSIGRFGGIDWVRDNETPTVAGGTGGAVTVHRPIVFGAESLLSAPFEGMGDLLRETDVSDVPSIQMVGPANGVQVAMITRPPMDRLQQILSSTWSWVGDFGVPSDSTTGDASLFKRAVVLEHA